MLGKYLWHCAVNCFMRVKWKGENILGWEEVESPWGQPQSDFPGILVEGGEAVGGVEKGTGRVGAERLSKESRERDGRSLMGIKRPGWADVLAGLLWAGRRTGETSPQAWAPLPAKSLDRDTGN